MFFDYHIHSNFSYDGSASLENLAAKAVAQKLDGICFTDHMEINHLGEISFKYDEYINSVKKIKDQFKDSIQIACGVEAGLQLSLITQLNSFLQEKHFDFVIGSVHCVHNKMLLNSEFCQGRNRKEAYTEYLNYILDIIKKFDNFDVLGHLDIIRRFNGYEDNTMGYEDYKDLLDEILRELIYHGKGIEINTSGKRHGLDFYHPSMEILKAYKGLGGEIITTGSDAHRIECIACDFEDTYEILRQCGFKYITTFKNRIPTQVRI